MIILFECKKFFKKSKNILLLLVAIALLVTLSISESKKLEEDKNNIIMKDTLTYMNLKSDVYMVELDRPELVKYYYNGMEALDKKLIYANKHDWKNSLKQEIKYIKNLQSIQEYGGILGHQYDFDYELLKSNQYFLDEDIKPENSLHGVSASYYIREIFTHVFSVYAYIFGLLLFFDLFAGEKENNNLPFLRTVPISYRYFRIGKMVFAIFLVLVSILIFLFLVFGLGIIFSKNVGILNYPILFNIIQNKVITLSYLEYFGYSLTIFIIINYLILLTLVILDQSKIQSEKILVTMISLIISTSSFAEFLPDNNCLSFLSKLFNTHDLVEWIFINNYMPSTLMILFIFSALIILTNFILKIKENTFEV